jgi:hypothetical protein
LTEKLLIAFGWQRWRQVLETFKVDSFKERVVSQRLEIVPATFGSSADPLQGINM